MKKDNKVFFGYGAALASTFLFGLGDVLTKAIYMSGVNPLMLFKIRVDFSVIILLGVLLIFSRKSLRIEKKDIFKYFILGVVGFSGFVVCCMIAISMINVGVAVFLQYLAPAFIIFFYWTVFHQKPSRTIIIAVMLTIIGGLLMIFSPGNHIQLGFLGIFFGVMCAILYGFSSVFGKKLNEKYSPMTTLFYSLLFSAIAWFFVPTGHFNMYSLTPQLIGIYIYVIAVYTVLTYGLFFYALSQLSATNTTLIASLEPVIAAVIAYFFLSEKMSVIEIFGGLLLLLAIYILQRTSAS